MFDSYLFGGAALQEEVPWATRHPRRAVVVSGGPLRVARRAVAAPSHSGAAGRWPWEGRRLGEIPVWCRRVRRYGGVIDGNELGPRQLRVSGCSGSILGRRGEWERAPVGTEH